VKNLVKHLHRPARTALAALTLLASSAALNLAQALQDIDVTPDGMTTARIALHDATRIRVDGQAIKQVYGSGVQDQKNNPGGALIVQALNGRGEISVIPAQGIVDKAISVFIDTQKATYTLVLIPTETPAETIVLHDHAKAKALANCHGDESSRRAPAFYRAIKRLVLALEGTNEDQDLPMTHAHEQVELWPESRFILTERATGDDNLRGERYLLTNLSAKAMHIDERELYASDVVAVSIEKAELMPRGSTAVYLVRETGHDH
jgi:conjugal transfer pilus assembly protein TraK